MNIRTHKYIKKYIRSGDNVNDVAVGRNIIANRVCCVCTYKHIEHNHL